MDILYNLFFYLIAGILVISALGVVFLPRIVYSAVAMILAFLSVAGVFILLNADFLAISQVIIYATGITIIIIFAIMMTGKQTDKELWVAFAPRTLFSFAISGALFVTVLFAITDGFRSFLADYTIFSLSLPSIEILDTLQTQGTTGIIGKLLLTTYVLPFEVLSLLLIAAVLGSVVIAKKDRDNLVNPTTAFLQDDEAE